VKEGNIVVDKITEKMQVVILAAGRGLRLGRITDKVPKVLVKVGGVPFIINQLEALSKHKEIYEIIIVVGYKKELIKKEIGNQYKGMKITYVENSKWVSTNNIYSLWLTLDLIKNSFIIMEGDIFFEHRLLDFLFEKRDKNVVLLSSYKPWMSGTLAEIDKETNTIRRLIPESDQDEDFDYKNRYKTINIYSFDYKFFEEYLKPSLDLYAKTLTKDYWELMLGVLIYLRVPNIFPHIVSNINWYEVDNENDLDAANYLFADNTKKMEILSTTYGGLWRYNIIDFCYLANPYFPTRKLYAELSQNMSQLISNYPSGQQKISKLLSLWFDDKDIGNENLIVGNGASELITIMNRDRDLIKKITIPVPTFNEYEDIRDDQKNYFGLKEDDEFRLDPDKYIDAVKRSGSNFALIINPNNPTGTLSAREDIIKIIESLKSLDGIIVDESFINFSAYRNSSIQSLINEYQNLIIVHSIGKEFGVLGIRLGYMLTSNQLVLKKVRDSLPLWNVNAIAEKYLELFPKYKNKFKESIDHIIEERERLYAELKKINFLKTFPSHANFFLCKILNGGNSKDLAAQLIESNIYIKDCSNKTSLNDKFIRIAVRSRSDNDILIDTMKKLEIK
jgi:histidinol-phosphate/aromatic aminotransferase/cobyric acid decarboxylase-like protein/choline kinase